MKLNIKDINDLIEIGKSLDHLNKDLLISFRNRDYINRQHGDTWRNFVIELSDQDLVSVFKALVIIESELKWIGGSVAGAIWVYNVIEQRQLDTDYKIADYGLRNCENPWVPFGGSYYGKRTILDYFAYKTEKARESSIKSDRYEKVLKRVEGRKEKRATAIAELRKLSTKQRGHIRAELLAKHQNSTIIEKFTLIADEEIYPPEYYPTEWIQISKEEIEKLPIELIKGLYDKLSTKTKGDWKRFAQELQKLDDGI